MSNPHQETKIQVLQELEQHRFLTEKQIRLLIGMDKEEMTRILADACLTHLLDSIILPFDLPLQNDDRVFCLARKGAEMLALKENLPMESVKYTTPSSRKKSLLFLEHNVCLNELILCLEILNNTGLEILHLQKEPDDLHLKAMVKGDNGKMERVPVIPDAVFSVKLNDKVSTFLCEIDRGTVNLGRMEKRFRAYQLLWKSRVLEKSLQARNVRILVITTSQRRLQNLLDRVKRIEAGQGLFWMTTQENLTLEKPERFFELIWITTKSEGQALFD